MKEVFLYSPVEIGTWDILIRLGLSFLAGLIIGLERGRHKQILSLRPHILICIGSTLVMLLSIYLPQEFGFEKNFDPGRIAAQVVSGIGFLGAGAIIKMGVNVKGITTATTIWVAAAIGLAIGAGLYFAAFTAVALILLVLILIDQLEKSLFRESLYKVIHVSYSSLEDLKEQMIPVLKAHRVRILTINVEKDYENGVSNIHFHVHIAVHTDTELLCRLISQQCNTNQLRYVKFQNMD